LKMLMAIEAIAVLLLAGQFDSRMHLDIY